jgi:hypothetical protein
VNAGFRWDYVTDPTGWPLYQILDYATAVGYNKVPTVFKNNPNARNFEPRIGLAYDPFNDHKTSIRAGFGIFFDPIGPRSYGPQYWAGPPNGAVLAVGPSFPNPFVNSPVCNPSVPSTCQAPNEAAGMSWYINNAPYVIQYNFTIQREIARGTVLSVGYIGSQGVHLLEQISGDPVLCSPVGVDAVLHELLVSHGEFLVGHELESGNGTGGAGHSDREYAAL